MQYLSDSAYWLYLAHLPLISRPNSRCGDWPIPAFAKFLLIVAVVTSFLLWTYQIMVRYTWLGRFLNGLRIPAREGSGALRGCGVKRREAVAVHLDGEWPFFAREKPRDSKERGSPCGRPSQKRPNTGRSSGQRWTARAEPKDRPLSHPEIKVPKFDARGGFRDDGRPEGPMLIGYARVSTADRKLDLQNDALTKAGCERIFTDTAGGASAERAGLEQALAFARKGDTLVVWKLDRLGRSLRHLVETVAALRDRGIGFRSLQESIDTTTSGGKLVFHVFGALAEFEREILRDRVKAGIAQARKEGRPRG